MSIDRQYGASPQIPRQKLAFDRKGDSWRESTVNAIDGIATTSNWDGRSSSARKETNYDLLNSKIDPVDYKKVLDPFGYGDKYGAQPAELRSINIIRNKIEKLKGDEIQRPFDFVIMAIDGGGVTAKEESQKASLLKTAEYILRREAGLTEEDEDQVNFQSLEEAATASTTQADIREQYASAVVRNGFEDQRLEAKFSEGFEHGLTVGEEIYYTGIVANEPVVRVVNPIYFEWEKGPETSDIQDAGWCREERYMTVSEIIDEYSEFLEDKHVRMLDDGVGLHSANRNSQHPGFAYTDDTLNSRRTSSQNSSFIRVVTVCWKSFKKIGFKIYFDEDGNEQETLVDESEKLTPEEEAQGARIEWQWINEVWKGTKIGDDIFCDINPVANQMRSMDNPAMAKLPYIGKTYNNLNSETTSMVDLMKPHQYLYNIVWYRLENEIAKAKGKKMIMDLAQLPTTHGMTMEKWMYYFDTTGIAYINSFEEGKAGTRMQGQQAQFNQFQQIDLSLSNVVQQYMMILNKLEGLIDTISGVSQQSEGNIGQYETATGIQNSMANSSTITEYYFFRHDEIKREVLRQYIEVSKYAYAGGKKLHYITNDMARISMEIDGDMFIDSDYNVFPTNANKDKMTKMKIEQLAPMAMQQDKANLSDMVKLFNTNSISEFESQLIAGEQDKFKRDSEAQESQERMNQANIQAAEAQDERNHEQAMELATLKGQLDISKAVVTAQGFDTDKDRDGNGIPDVVEVGADQIEKIKGYAAANENSKTRAHDSYKQDKDLKFKERELASKERMNKENNKVALKNKVVGEK